MFIIKAEHGFYSGMSTVGIKTPRWHNRLEEAREFRTREEAEAVVNEIKEALNLQGVPIPQMAVFNIQVFKRF